MTKFSSGLLVAFLLLSFTATAQFSLTIGSASNVQNGQQVCLNVTAANFTNIVGMQFSINYNPAMLQLTSVSNFGLPGLSAGGSFGLPIAGGAGTTSAGTITMTWTDPDQSGETVANGATLFTLCFNALTGTGSTQVSFSSTPTSIEVINASLQNVPFNSVPGTVSFTGGGGNPTPIALTVGSQSNVMSGTQVCLNVTVQNFTNIRSFQTTLTYSSTMLQSATVSNFGVAGMTAANFNTSTPGTIVVNWTNATAQTVASGGVLFRVCFTANASSGSTQVTAGSSTATNASSQSVPVNNTAGTVSFSSGNNPTGFTLTMGSATNVQSGQQVCLNVTAANFTNIVGMQFSISYNPAMLQLTSVNNFGLPGLTAGGSFGLPIAGGAGSTSAGTITMTWTDPDQGGETVANGATLFTLCFNALANTGSTQVAFTGTPTSIEVINASLQNVPFNSVPGTVSFTGGGGGNPTGFTLTMGSATNVQSGQQVCLNVTAANFTNIVGMQFSINYNPAMLQLTSVSGFGLPGLTAGGSFGLPIAGGAGSTSAGTITMTWTDPDQGGETVANGATLFTLCFNALASTGSTQVTFTGTPTSIEVINTALQNVPFNSVPGMVTFGNSGPSPIALTVGSQSNVMSGAQVCLDVTVQNFTNINAFQTTLTYNSTMLQSVAVSNFGVAGMTAANFNTSTPGTIVVNWTNATAQTVASGGVLFRLCFTANASSGSTQVTVGTSTATNASSQSVTVNSTPGTVSFNTPTGFTLTMGSATNVQSGQQVCLNVTAANFTNIVGMQFSISYNPAMLQLTSVTNFGLPGLTAGGSFGLPIAGGAGTTAAGTITMTWTDPDQGGETVANGATLFTLCFNALASTGSTQVTFTGTPTSIEVINTALQNVPFNSVPGTVTFGNSGTTPIALTVGSQSNVMSGAQVCLDVTVQNFTNINAFQTTLTYNSTMLQSVVVSNFGVAGMTAANFNTSTPGTIVVNWTNATAQTVASGGVLFRLCFTANAGSGSTQVTVGTSTATNASSQSVTVNSTPGTVSFNTPTGFTLTIGSASNVQSGQQVCLNVTAANFTNIVGMQFSINYNPAMLQLTSVTNFGLPGLTAGGSFGLPIAGGAGTTAAGTITMTWTDPDQGGETMANGATLFTLCFNALASTGSTQVTFTGTPTSIEVINTALQNVPFNSIPGTVTFGISPPSPISLTVGSQSNVMSGAQVCLDVTVQNFTNINSFQTTLTYNSTMLQSVAVSNFGVAGMTAANFNTSTPGTIVVNWTNATPQTVASGGVLFRLCFTANASSGSTQVTVGTSTATNASSQSVTVNSTPGTVSFGSAPPTPIALTVGSQSNVMSGAQVCLDVTVQNFTNINAFQTTLTYNSALLQSPTVSNFGVAGMTAANFNTSTPGTIVVNWTNAMAQTVASGGVLFRLCFTANASSGSTPVTVGTSTATNASSQSVTVNSTPGTVSFNTPTGFTLIMGNASNVQSGQQVCLNVTAANFTNIVGMQFSISYNPAMLQLTSVSGFGLPGLTAGGNFGLPIAGGAGSTSAGTITMTWTDPDQGGETVTNGATLFTLCFNALVSTGSTQVTFTGTPTSIEVINTALQNVPFNSIPGTVTFGSVPPPPISLTVGSQSNVMSGAQVCLDVTVQNFTNINSFQTTLTYSSTMLQNVAVSNFGVAGMTAANFNTSTPGTIVVNWTNAMAQTVASGGVLFRLCFTANASSGSTQVTVGTSTATNASSQSVTVNSTPGTVTFSSVPPPPISLTVGSQSNVQPSQLVCLNVTAQNFTNINSLQSTFTYNPAMLQFASVGSFGVAGLTAGNFNTTTAGTIVLNWTNATGQTVAGGATLFNICFNALASSGSTQVSVGSTSATNGNGQTVVVNGTAGTVSFTVPINPPVIATPANITNVTCFGASTGAIDISVSGGTGNYTYMWSYQNRTTQDLTGIPAGTYSVTVTDTGSSQTTSGSFTVTQPASGISIIAIPTNVGCTGASTGAISLNVSGGTGSYNYNWSGTLPDGTPNQSNLPAGTYAVTITDANNCTASQSITITEPVGLPLTISSMVQPVVCGGASTGRITLTISGGTPNYFINWCCGLPANNTTVSNLQAGTYNVTVTDNNGCTATRSINVGQNPVLQLTSITPTHINNGNDGAINITVTGGTGGYSFAWTGPTGFGGSNQPNLSALNFPGQYCVTVTDNSGCTTNGCIQLDERLRFGNVQIGRSCAGASTGNIQVSLLGGVPPYNYNWNPGGALGPNRSNLAAGTYNVTVTDQAGGVLAGSFVVENFPTAVVSGTVVNASGNITDANGSVTLSITGGTPGYTVNWAPGGATGLLLSNVLTGEYCATVTDMAGCSVVQCFMVGFNPGPLVILNSQTTPVTCPGDQNGALNITLNGGLPPFTYLFSDGFTQTVPGVSFSRSGLPGGMLTYTVTDAQGTVINGSATIATSAVVTTTNIAVVHDTEEPGCTGSVSLSLTGGTTPYQLQWNTPNTGGPAINNLCAGTFIATVTDGNGCVFVLPGVVVNTFGLSASSTATNCPGDVTGSVNLTVAGGRAPYTYEWRNAAGAVVSNNEDLTNAAPGTYTVRVTEGSGNVLTRTYSVSSQSTLTLDVEITSNYNGFDVRCHNSTDGAMEATAFNGQGNYTYEWRRNGNIVGGSAATLTNAAPGNYEVRVTDGLGCSTTETLTLEAPQPVTVTANTQSPGCVGSNDGQVFASASGGVFALPYNYEWSNGAFGPRITFLRAGAYTVTVNDVNNCTTTATFTVSDPAPITVSVNSTPATDGCNGSVLAVVTGGNGPFTFTWSTGQVTTEPFLTGLCPGEYFVMVTDSRSCRPDPNLASGLVRDRRTPCLDIRTVITPDGDGLNEEFIISCVDEFDNNHLAVYNRWGQLVYETDNYDNTWTGTTRNGSDLPDGPYYFVFEYTDIDGIRQQLKGSITILRR